MTTVSKRAMRGSKVLLFSYFLLGCSRLTRVECWGKDGHRIIGNLAYDRLTNSTQKIVADILRNEDGSYGDDDISSTPLGSVANWADKVRFTKFYSWSTPLHYVDVRDNDIKGGCPCNSPNTTIASSNCVFHYDRDCANDKCAVGAIVNYTNRLTDPHSFLRERRDPYQHRVSLRFLTHFVGDLHQPLHCARSSDKGGNTFHVHFDAPIKNMLQQRDGTFESKWNLHSVWDVGIIEKSISEYYGSRQGLEKAILKIIYNMEKSGEIEHILKCPDGRQKECGSAWAEESLNDALNWAYRNSDGKEVENGSVLPDEYFTTRLPIVLHRLAAASIRLAASLEAVLSDKKVIHKKIKL
eukprot:CAMPEP_0195335998 /NCGR_PEP_ID=MMETSP0708-20121125/15937_1 /TAXON_ID=33640 /ORGANISM="Asterionellopsis glacialis, Strain CCMP134" /LENGTH=353 /DNA_ID=CAMNT_0040406515 /DNA_START=31 /DNA_END=1092 /DNA_ORIENTATION=-